VNVIPGEARIETYVRGKTLDGIRDADAKVDRALKAGALALGATVEIETWPGYLPLECDPTMAELFREHAHTLVGECRAAGHRAGCTDMGDVSQIMPVLHPYMGGASGTGHAADYAITNPRLGYVEPAKALAAMVVDLLWGDAAAAREVIAKARPRMTRESYLAFQRSVKRRDVFEGNVHG
jgi:metal-dependent amidase/aminoacylase/carboxypeptidase family protein